MAWSTARFHSLEGIDVAYIAELGYYKTRVLHHEIHCMSARQHVIGHFSCGMMMKVIEFVSLGEVLYP